MVRLHFQQQRISVVYLLLPLIILCTEKDSITTEYALGGLSNNIFAPRYVLYMPNKEELIAQVEAVLEKKEN